MDSSAGAEGISFPAFRGILGDSRVLTDFLPPLNFFRRFTFTFSKKCCRGGIANGNTNRMGYSARAGGFRLRISGRALGL